MSAQEGNRERESEVSKTLLSSLWGVGTKEGGSCEGSPYLFNCASRMVRVK